MGHNVTEDAHNLMYEFLLKHKSVRKQSSTSSNLNLLLAAGIVACVGIYLLNKKRKK